MFLLQIWQPLDEAVGEEGGSTVTLALFTTWNHKSKLPAQHALFCLCINQHLWPPIGTISTWRCPAVDLLRPKTTSPLLPAQTWELLTRARTGAKCHLVKTARTPLAKCCNEVCSISWNITVSFQGWSKCGGQCSSHSHPSESRRIAVLRLSERKCVWNANTPDFSVLNIVATSADLFQISPRSHPVGTV